MKSVGNLGGTLYWKNSPIIKFKFVRGLLKDYELLTDNKGILPIEINLKGVIPGLEEFIIDRPTPDTRIGIHEMLANSPIQYYDVERMLRYCHAQSVEDCYWIKQDDDITCWKGSTLESIGITPVNKYDDLETAKRWR